MNIMFILESMSVNKYFQAWLLIGWQHSCQPIRNHVRKSILTIIDFNMGFFRNQIIVGVALSTYR